MGCGISASAVSLIQEEVGVADRAVAEAVMEPVAVRLGVRVIEGLPVPERVGVPLRDGVRVGDTALREAVALRGGNADALESATLEVVTLFGGNADVLAVAALEGDEDDAIEAEGDDAMLAVAAVEADALDDDETPAPDNLRSYRQLAASIACSISKVRSLMGLPVSNQVRQSRNWQRPLSASRHNSHIMSYTPCVGAGVVAGVAGRSGSTQVPGGFGRWATT
jgi:hypothetical protein